MARDLKARPDTCAIPLIAATGYSHVKQLDRRVRPASTP